MLAHSLRMTKVIMIIFLINQLSFASIQKSKTSLGLIEKVNQKKVNVVEFISSQFQLDTKLKTEMMDFWKKNKDLSLPIIEYKNNEYIFKSNDGSSKDVHFKILEKSKKGIKYLYNEKELFYDFSKSFTANINEMINVKLVHASWKEFFIEKAYAFLPLAFAAAGVIVLTGTLIYEGYESYLTWSDGNKIEKFIAKRLTHQDELINHCYESNLYINDQMNNHSEEEILNLETTTDFCQLDYIKSRLDEDRIKFMSMIKEFFPNVDDEHVDLVVNACHELQKKKNCLGSSVNNDAYNLRKVIDDQRESFVPFNGKAI